jgi:uncharacterized protein YjbI with pentapeptide repeats
VAEGFTCEVADEEYLEEYRCACVGRAFYGEHEGKRYCVLHFPGEKKVDAFKEVLESKLAQKDYNFSGTVFPEGTSDFRGFEFDADVRFSGATFVGRADFRGAHFNGDDTIFSEATFNGEHTSFWLARFRGDAHFSKAQFKGDTVFEEVLFSGDANFSEALFKGAWTGFSDAQFRGMLTLFSNAQFSGKITTFRRAYFSGKKTDFLEAEAVFSEVNFSGEETYFSNAQFRGDARFSKAQFNSGETDFGQASFSKDVDFNAATFSEKVVFEGTTANLVFASQAWVRFDGSRIDSPELLTFKTVLLHPGWFINADVRKVDFTDVKWYGMPSGPKGTLDAEISFLLEKRRDIESPHTLLAQSCRRLSANAEENREYPLANEFHYWSMDAVRKESWSHFKGLTLESLAKTETRCDIRKHFGLVTTLYWALSGYGVRAGRALGVLVVVWAVFAILYMLLGPPELRVFSPEVWWLPSILAGFPAFVPSELDLISVRSIGEVMGHIGQAMVYSLSTLARLNPKPEPEPGLFQFLVTIEGILGPLQIALLALAIRRKVMR